LKFRYRASEFQGLGRAMPCAARLREDAPPQWVINKIAAALNEKGKAIKGAKILVLGLACKKSVECRRSPGCASTSSA
jgi:UDP-N-acetyl-D-glucosamine dehydrogenase